MKPKRLELLSPGANAETAIQAILHGADAVYIGPASHGARKSVSNSTEDIKQVVELAHVFRVRVYATVNTIVYEHEIKDVEKLCKDLYKAGVDALIVQDMGILRMDIPPIELHASTQCDIRTPEKAKFLQDAGFSQLVLARELTIPEIKAITESVSIPVETFIHGSLCVSYSGKCHASLALTGRSANRGDCSQICRYPYSLIDSEGKIVVKDKYLLSLKDFNASHNLENLIEAGVSSFKIEGRLKDISYVKNITAYYNNELNRIIMNSDGRLKRSSFGKVETNFQPSLCKSFNRGFTEYFLKNRRPDSIASLFTPKSLGEEIKNIRQLHNGDGISFFDNKGHFTGVNVNKISGNRIIPAKDIVIPDKVTLYRTSDVEWEKLMRRNTSERTLSLSISIDPEGITAIDERGVSVRVPLNLTPERANKPMDYRQVFEKLGGTPYRLSDYISKLDPFTFYRLSEMTSLRRKVIELLDVAASSTYPFKYRRKENIDSVYILNKVDYRENIANSYARSFYKSHGVNSIETAAEVNGNINQSGKILMTTRHCVLRELGMCKKSNAGNLGLKFPLYLDYGKGRLKLDFDCENCEMKVVR